MAQRAVACSLISIGVMRLFSQSAITAATSRLFF